MAPGCKIALCSLLVGRNLLRRRDNARKVSSVMVLQWQLAPPTSSTRWVTNIHVSLSQRRQSFFIELTLHSLLQITAILTNLAKTVSEKVKSRHQNVKRATIEFRVIDGQRMQTSQNLLLHKTDNSSQILLWFNDMEMSDPEFYNLAKTAKQRYWYTILYDQ